MFSSAANRCNFDAAEFCSFLRSDTWCQFLVTAGHQELTQNSKLA